MSEIELAAAMKLQQDGGDIAALIIENVTAAGHREGRETMPTDFSVGVGLLMSAAWQMAKAVGPDLETARRLYAGMLRRHADAVEGDGLRARRQRSQAWPR